ncbi:ABC transporter ATP-binding protein [Sedimentibacter sp. zth1]|uniref:ATP-binding cassette domain-containing protein n=1 Tax=Sedimentibacter sp. zth1 TaxID=2816908 RepID=UPI001A90D26A|nr:ABC transporter ATP-binding protein [Sedimentibacter sp. zth1]QSX06468.1 ABC transporter ATP-binding protein [Sedimentibacter sp. zth1]
MLNIKMPKHVKKYCAISVIVYLIINILSKISPIIMKQIIDVAIPCKDMKLVFNMIITFTCLPIIVTTSDVFYFKYINKKIWENALEVNFRVFKKIMRQPINYFIENNHGDLMNLYKSDITQLYSYFLVELPKLISGGIVAIVLLIYLFTISPIIFYIELISIPLIILPTKKIFAKVKNLSKNIFSSNGKRIGIVNETLLKNKLVKVNNLEKMQEDKLLESHNDLITSWKKIFVYDLLTSSWTNSFVAPLLLAFAFIYSANMVIKGEMTIGSLIIIISYLPIINSFLGSLASTNIRLAQKNEEFIKVMEMSKEQTNISKECICIKDINSVKLNNLSFGYNVNECLFNSINLTLNKGEVLCIKGANGSGKSTLIDLMLGLYKPLSGCIVINENSLDSLDKKAYYENISYVMQDVEIFSDSIRNSFKVYNHNITDEKIYEYLKCVNLDQVILNSKDGLDTKVSLKADNLSGGEKRKLFLALALTKNANLIILDEVTQNLDDISIKIIHNTLENIKQKGNKIIIIITHDEYLNDLADKFLKL